MQIRMINLKMFNFVASFSFMKATAHLLYIIFTAKVRNVFYKLNVHAGRCYMQQFYL